jgi:GMP synthase (glutamine-hydrolysing)
MRRSTIRALLIQIREDASVKQEELESFARYAELGVHQIKVHDVFKHPHFNKEILADTDILFVGGASEASVSEPEKYLFVESIKNVLNAAVELKLPTFASCFGFQAAVLAFGGEIIKDTQNFEMGTLPIMLTSAASSDPIFKNTPNPFYAVSVHQEKAISLPDSCQLLAYTDECTHAFKVHGVPFWAFQFHPELDKPTLEYRLGVYKDGYTEDREHFEGILKSLRETPESNLLVKKFVKVIIEST